MKKNIIAFIAIFLSLAQPSRAITLPDSISTFLEKASVTELGTITGSDDDISAFLEYFKANWQSILNDIDQVAPTKSKQYVIISAAENLEPTIYMSFLSSLLDKYQANKIKKEVASTALSPEAKKFGFLEYNYTNASVIALCNRVKIVFPDDVELKERMKDILSGEQKKQTGAALGMENRPLPEILPAP